MAKYRLLHSALWLRNEEGGKTRYNRGDTFELNDDKKAEKLLVNGTRGPAVEKVDTSSAPKPGATTSGKSEG